MKMVKSLLLGSAAGMVAVAGAQAADLPVKAKPVEYVKICSLYGDGFYYIPGTDTCLQLGGYVRADYGYNNVGARTPQYSGTAGAQDRTVSPWSTRHRANVNIDVRTQTQYGTLRTYMTLRINNQDQAEEARVSRAFIQWAGFTFGRIKSLTDPFGSLGDDGFRALHQSQNQSDSGSNGVNQIAYTWELGNGASFSVGADEYRNKNLSNMSNAAWTVGATPTSSRHGEKYPDPWAVFKVSQAWGDFSVAIIGHDNSALYYTGTTPTTGNCPAGQTGTTLCTYPSDKFGWAVLSGVMFKVPFIAPGDRIGGYFNYGVGATGYSAGSNLASPGLFGGGNQVALGLVQDGAYINGGDIQLTTAWTVGAGFEHWWTPTFSSVIGGTYTEVSYNSTVVGGRFFCGAASRVVIAATSACDPSMHYWQVLTHTDWYPVSGLRLAVEAELTGVDTSFSGQTITLLTTQGARPTGAYLAKNQHILSTVFRAQRNFPSGGE